VKQHSGFAVLIAVLCATSVYAHGYGGMQGGAGGGGSSGALTVTGTLEVNGTNLLAFGGTTSTYPALRYGSAAGVIEFLRADGSSGLVKIRYPSGPVLEFDTTAFNIYSADESAFLGVDDTGVSVQDTILKNASGTTVASIQTSTSLDVTGAGGIALKDVTSAPTVTAGYHGVYSLNTNGLQQLTVKGSTGAVTLATQGYYAGGGHFIVSKNADQTFSNVGETVTWTTETTDQPGGVDVSTYNTRVFTAPAAGVVTVTFKIRGAADADPFDGIVKRWNSSDVEQTGIGDRDDAWFQGDGTNAFTCMWTVIRHMDAGDYLTLQVFTPSGIDLDDGGSNATRAAVAAGFFVPD
jgi:hypothetical protein